MQDKIQLFFLFLLSDYCSLFKLLCLNECKAMLSKSRYKKKKIIWFKVTFLWTLLLGESTLEGKEADLLSEYAIPVMLQGVGSAWTGVAFETLAQLHQGVSCPDVNIAREIVQ